MTDVPISGLPAVAQLTGDELFPVVQGGVTKSALVNQIVLNAATNPLEVSKGGTGADDAAEARVNLGAAASGANSDITSLSGLTTPLSLEQGGTGAATSDAARTNLVAARSGANTDITSLASLTTPLTIAQGGTGANTAAAARTNLGVAAAGNNTDILTLQLANGTGAAPSVAFSSDSNTGLYRFNEGAIGFSSNGSTTTVVDGGGVVTTTLVANTGVSTSNAVITGGSITGITDLAIADGGTGASTAAGARTNLGLGSIATQNSSSVSITGGSLSNVTISGGAISGITDLAVSDGGTGASTAAGARTNLGAAASGANTDITSLALGNGLVSAPSVSFASDPDTGFYSSNSGAVTFSSNGTATVILDNLGVTSERFIAQSGGSAASPSVIFAGDGNTGLYQPAPDQVGISTNGAARVLVTNSGAAVTGLASATNVQVGDGLAATPAIAFSGDSDTGFYRTASGQVGYSSNGTTSTILAGSGINSSSFSALSAGSAGAPVFSFTSDPNTGFYNISDGQVGFSSNGSLVTTLNGSGVSTSNLVAGSGTVSAPSISFSGDSDTGIYRVGADQFALVTNGVSRLTVSSTNVSVTNLNAADISAPTISCTTITTSNLQAVGGSITGITDLAIADGGTGASTAAGARTNLGLGTAAVENYTATTSFTPTVSFVTPGDLSVSYVMQTGRYSRIANLVFFNINLEFSLTYTTASGALLINGLPFAEGLGQQQYIGAAYTGNIGFGASATNVVARVTASATDVRLFGTGATINPVAIGTSQAPSGATVYTARITGVYYAA